jgi:hypothetical protein
VRKFLFIILTVTFAFCAQGADDYKSVLILTNGNSIRVRLPLTDVTGKVRVKEMSPDGFGIPIAPSKAISTRTITLNGKSATTFRTRIARASFQN